MEHVTAKGRIVVIGSGAAGTGAARTLAAAGWDVTVAERDRVGGTCLWRGCMPKKALYNAARARRNAERAEMFGLEGATGFDWQSVLAWKWHSQETYAGDQEAGFADRGIRLVKGHARFVSPDAIEIDGVHLPFDHAVVAAGSRPVMPPITGIELADTSTGALSYSDPPASLLVVGGGFIGVELATVFASFGSEVTVITAGVRPPGDARRRTLREYRCAGWNGSGSPCAPRVASKDLQVLPVRSRRGSRMGTGHRTNEPGSGYCLQSVAHPRSQTWIFPPRVSRSTDTDGSCSTRLTAPPIRESGPLAMPPVA
jgi:hypothetical protein